MNIYREQKTQKSPTPHHLSVRESNAISAIIDNIAFKLGTIAKKLAGKWTKVAVNGQWAKQ